MRVVTSVGFASIGLSPVADAAHSPDSRRSSGVPLDPAIEEDAVIEASRADLQPSLDAFQPVIDAGVRVVMTGPALVPARDTERAASRSAKVVDILRSELGLGGVIDLDAPAILRGSAPERSAIDALAAGVDRLLVAGTVHLPNLVAAVVERLPTVTSRLTAPLKRREPFAR